MDKQEEDYFSESAEEEAAPAPALPKEASTPLAVRGMAVTA